MNIYRGNIVFTKDKDTFQIYEHGYIVVDSDGIIEDVYAELPIEYTDIKVKDYGECLIIPGFTDLHMHPNQYPNIGLGYDMELMPWIETYATPCIEYFKTREDTVKIWSAFITDLWKYGITRSVQFGPLDYESTDVLFDMMIKSGLSCYLGKNHTDYKKDRHETETTEESKEAAMRLYEKWEGKSKLVHYILTPSFAPGCTPELMRWVGETARKYKLPVQSHLDENRTEVKMVKERFPDSRNYSDVYVKSDMFGNGIKTIMAHCIHTTEDEIQLLRDSDIYVAHCVHSNFDLASGIMPLRRYLDEGIKVGLGSDISGGHTMNMMDIMRTTIEASKYYFVKEGKKPVTISEAFYLATKGGGSFFGKVGSFEPGYTFDALVVDDDAFPNMRNASITERIERFIYNGDDRQIKIRFCDGAELAKPDFK